LAHIHYKKFATGGYIASPPNVICVTALPCKILITTLPVCLYMFTIINNNKYKNICTLDKTHVQKRHNTDYGTSSVVIKDFLQHKCPLLSRIARNQVYVSDVVCCHSNWSHGRKGVPVTWK